MNFPPKIIFLLQVHQQTFRYRALFLALRAFGSVLKISLWRLKSVVDNVTCETRLCRGQNLNSDW